MFIQFQIHFDHFYLSFCPLKTSLEYKNVSEVNITKCYLTHVHNFVVQTTLALKEAWVIQMKQHNNKNKAFAAFHEKINNKQMKMSDRMLVSDFRQIRDMMFVCHNN